MQTTPEEQALIKKDAEEAYALSDHIAPPLWTKFVDDFFAMQAERQNAHSLIVQAKGNIKAVLQWWREQPGFEPGISVVPRPIFALNAIAEDIEQWLEEHPE